MLKFSNKMPSVDANGQPYWIKPVIITQNYQPIIDTGQNGFNQSYSDSDQSRDRYDNYTQSGEQNGGLTYRHNGGPNAGTNAGQNSGPNGGLNSIQNSGQNYTQNSGQNYFQNDGLTYTQNGRQTTITEQNTPYIKHTSNGHPYIPNISNQEVNINTSGSPYNGNGYVYTNGTEHTLTQTGNTYDQTGHGHLYDHKNTFTNGGEIPTLQQQPTLNTHFPDDETTHQNDQPGSPNILHNLKQQYVHQIQPYNASTPTHNQNVNQNVNNNNSLGSSSFSSSSVSQNNVGYRQYGSTNVVKNGGQETGTDNFDTNSIGFTRHHVMHDVTPEEELFLDADVSHDFLSLVNIPQYGKVGLKYSFRCMGRIAPERYHDFKVDIRGESDTRHNLDITWEKNYMEVSFIPTTAGTHTVRVTDAGVEVKGSPVYILIRQPRPPPSPQTQMPQHQHQQSSRHHRPRQEVVVIKGQGHRKGATGDEQWITLCNARDIPSDISILIWNKLGSVMHKERVTSAGAIVVTYTPYTPGLHYIHIRTDYGHVIGSPFMANIVDVARVSLLDDISKWKDEDDKVLLEYNTVNTFHYDTGGLNGGMTTEVLSPNGRLVPGIQKTGKTNLQISFTPKQKGDHYIHTYWDSVPIRTSPILAYCPGPPVAGISAETVRVRGSGILVAQEGTPAHFLVDGQNAGNGKLTVEMKCGKTKTPVTITKRKCNRYLCTYTAPVIGSYLLDVRWSNKPVPGSPFTVKVEPGGDSTKVRVSGEGLKVGVAGKETLVEIDARGAGPGEIEAECDGPSHKIPGRLTDHTDRTYTLRLFPVETGLHHLAIRFDSIPVPGSPFTLRVFEPPTPSCVRVSGSGIEDGVLDTFNSEIRVETSGAGAGQLSVKVRGPKGGFKVQMQQCSGKDRSIICGYSPTEAGHYTINVRWSSEHVPNSPFHVNIFDNEEALAIWRLEKQNGVDKESTTDTTGSLDTNIA